MHNVSPLTNTKMKEYEIIVKFSKGPMAGHTLQMDWLDKKPLEVGSIVNHGEHKFKVISCKEVVFEEGKE